MPAQGREALLEIGDAALLELPRRRVVTRDTGSYRTSTVRGGCDDLGVSDFPVIDDADWRVRLRAAITIEDLRIVGYEAFGGDRAELDETRVGVLEVINEARAQGITEQDINIEIAKLRAGQADFDRTLSAAVVLQRDRERYAARELAEHDVAAWTSIEEVVRQLGTTTEVIEPHLVEAERRGLIERVRPPVGDWPALTVRVTEAGGRYLDQLAGLAGTP